MRRVDSLEKTLMLGGTGGRRRRGHRGWDGWMASPTRWTWVWVNSGRWWWMGRPGMVWFMGLQRVGHDWATELNWKKGRMIQTCVECLLRLRIKVHCNLRWLEPIYLNIIVNILFLRILVSSLPLFPLKVKKKKKKEKGLWYFLH